MGDIEETVVALRGRKLSAEAPEDGDLLRWNAEEEEWQPVPPPTATSIQGNPVTDTEGPPGPVGSILMWNPETPAWEPREFPFSAGALSGGNAVDLRTERVNPLDDDVDYYVGEHVVPLDISPTFYEWVEFTDTLSVWTAGHTVFFPDARAYVSLNLPRRLAYLLTVHNNTAFTMTLAMHDSHVARTNTRTLAPGLAQRFIFDLDGVRSAGPSWTP